MSGQADRQQRHHWLQEAFLAGVESVMPDQLIPRVLRCKGREIVVAHEHLWLEPGGRILVAGAGKASGNMAAACEGVLGDLIAGGVVVVKHGHTAPCQRVELVEAGHPYPDAAGVAATQRVVKLCQEAHSDDIVLFLISGGGSALLTDYPECSSLDEIMELSRLLVNSGASIQEINAVRKHLSGVKGGQLAQLAQPARVVTLVISDVVGDPLDVIASGPTVADPTTFADAVAVCHKYQIASQMPPTLWHYLQEGMAGRHLETPKPDCDTLHHVSNFIIGSNRVALEAVVSSLQKNGVAARIVSDTMSGDTCQMAEQVVKDATQLQQHPGLKGLQALVYGGETTLKVRGRGSGGRNQHLALYAAGLLTNQPGITLLAAGTDGNDGPTDMAGAMVDNLTFSDGLAAGLVLDEYLADFNSYQFFSQAGGHLYTGPTRTNVMDICIALIAH